MPVDLPYVTVNDVIAMETCWSADGIIAMADQLGVSRISLRELVRLPISLHDKLTLALSPAMLPAHVRLLFVAEATQGVLQLVAHLRPPELLLEMAALVQRAACRGEAPVVLPYETVQPLLSLTRSLENNLLGLKFDDPAFMPGHAMYRAAKTMFYAIRYTDFRRNAASEVAQSEQVVAQFVGADWDEAEFVCQRQQMARILRLAGLIAKEGDSGQVPGVDQSADG